MFGTWGGVGEARGAEIQYWQPNIVRRAKSNYEDASLYDGYLDKWSHSLFPTPTNPLSPIFYLLDPYYMERAHSEDRPYPVSGPMFTEGTPWGAVLNPTLGRIVKPEEELHPWRLRNGVDIVAMLNMANDSIRQRARDFTRTDYISIQSGKAAAVAYNAYGAPTDDIHIMSAQISPVGSGLAYGSIYNPVYGVYGRGGGSLFYGSSGGGSPYVASGFLGTPGSGAYQNLEAGFNAFEDDTGSYSHLFFSYPKIGQHILADKDDITLREAFYAKYFGGVDRITRNGDIIQDQTGRLGIYQNRPIREPAGTNFTARERAAINAVIKTTAPGDRLNLIEVVDHFDPLRLIGQLNTEIKTVAKQHVDSPYAFDDSQGFLSGAKLSSYNPTQAMDLLNDADTVSDLLNQGSGADFVRNAGTSARLIAGIYGYFGSELYGFGVHNEKVIQNSSDMYAFNRRFWDLNLGGAGGAISEIGRRFIPNFQRMTKVNPLRNTMPEWMPERFKYADAFSALPSSEARMPGKGWLTLNDLHPDMYSTPEDPYGAFDRMKILADIAPNSPEYKLWREISKKTVTDPELIEEMEQIKDRARQQGKKHDFYPYKVVGKSLDYQNIIVSEVLENGKFRSGETIYKLSGVTVKGNQQESSQDVLAGYIRPGQEITIATDTNPYYAYNRDVQKTINAAVYLGGESLSEIMLSNGDAEKRSSDKSAAATFGSMSGFQRFIGYTSEIIGHLDIPIISDQWLRIRSPYESYLAENVYGTPYQSWSHPIDTFFWPAVERAVHERSVFDILGYEAWNWIKDHERTPEFEINVFGINKKFAAEKLDRTALHLAHYTELLTNRATLVGYSVGNMFDTENVKLAQPLARVANIGVTAAHVLIGGNSYLDMAAIGAYLGDEIHRFNEAEKDQRGKFRVIGAAAAIGYRALKNPLGEDWIPERVKEYREMEDYWDRITYLKYMGLYHAAADKAKKEEGVDVETALRKIDKREQQRKAAIRKLQDIKELLGESYGGKSSYLKDRLVKMVNSRIAELHEGESLVEGGKYTQSAIIYKQAAESTMYGLKNGASWSEIITALPVNDREYFMEFVGENDPEERDKILRVASPGLRRALQMSWGMDTQNRVSNDKFFQTHYLPDKDWMGWRPETDLSDFKIRTVDNEAMNLADFGLYESGLREPGAVNATPLPWKKQNRDLSIASEITKILQGKGMTQVEVSVSELNTMSVSDVVANIGVWAGVSEQQKKVQETMYNWY